jgi:hypothetical protein
VSQDARTLTTVGTVALDWSTPLFTAPGFTVSESKRITAPASPAVAMAGVKSATLSVWYKLAAAITGTDARTLVGAGSGSSIRWRLALTATELQLIFDQPGGAVTVGGAVSLTTGSWRHAALVLAGDRMALFHNGARVWAGYMPPLGLTGAYGDVLAMARIGSEPGASATLGEVAIIPAALYSGTTYTPPTAFFIAPASSTPPSGGDTGPGIALLAATLSLLLHFEGANNSTTFTDSSPIGATMTRGGSAVISTTRSKFGAGSLYCASPGSYVTLSESSATLLDGDFTIELWAYQPNTNDRSLLSARGAGSSNVQIFRINDDGATGRVGVYIDTTVAATGLVVQSATGAAPSGEWTHLRFARKGSTAKLYINGAAVATRSSWTQAFRCDVIGSHFASGSVYTGGLGAQGAYIDELVIAKQCDSLDNFTPPALPYVPGVPFSLVTLLLHMNGGAFVDSGPLAAFATADGGLTPVSASYAISGGKVAEFTSNRSIYFVGSQAVAAFSFGTGDFTIEFFCYFSGSNFPSTAPILTVGDYTGDGFYLWLAGGMAVFTHRGENWTAGSATGMVLNAMNHVAYVRRGGVLGFWINGQLIGTPATLSTSINPATGSARTNNGQRVVIGNMVYHGYLAGQLEEVRETMGAVYTATFTPPSAPFPCADLAYSSGASDPLRSLVKAHLGFSGSSASNSISGTTVSAPSGVVTDTAGGKFGGTYLVCDGSRQLNVSGITGGLGAGEFTIEAWVYISESLGFRNFLDTRSGDGSNGIDLYTNGRVSTSGIWIFTESSNIPTNQWFHYAITRASSGAMVRWVNGVEDATSREVYDRNFTGDTLKVGNSFAGRLYEVRVTAGAAGSGACRYTASFTPPSGPF